MASGRASGGVIPIRQRWKPETNSKIDNAVKKQVIMQIRQEKRFIIRGYFSNFARAIGFLQIVKN